jgi:hypothetical protein
MVRTRALVIGQVNLPEFSGKGTMVDLEAASPGAAVEVSRYNYAVSIHLPASRLDYEGPRTGRTIRVVKGTRAWNESWNMDRTRLDTVPSEQKAEERGRDVVGVRRQDGDREAGLQLGPEDLDPSKGPAGHPAGLGAHEGGRENHVVAEHHFNFHLGEEIHDVFGAAIKFGVTLLPAKAFGLGDRDPLQTNFLQSLFHFVEFERLDDGLDFFHAIIVESQREY